MNPYLNRGPIIRPEDFVGRQREIEQIWSLIRHGTCVSLVGERRVGKSSILNMIKYDAESWRSGAEEFIFLSVDCQYHQKSTQEQVMQFILDRFEELGIKPREPTHQGLWYAARDVAQRFGNRRLVIVLDEIDVLAFNPNIPREFFSFLRSWSQDFRIVLAAASKENSIESIVWHDSAGSPFWNLFKTLYIGPFTPAEALTVVREPSLAQGSRFSQVEEGCILDLAGHQPFLLQIACDHAFQAKSSGLNDADLRRVLESEFRREAGPHLSYLWSQLPEKERDALSAFVLEGVPPSERIASELQRKGVLIDGPNGRRIFSKLLVERIAEEVRPEQHARQSLLAKVWNIYLK